MQTFDYWTGSQRTIDILMSKSVKIKLDLKRYSFILFIHLLYNQ